MSRLASSVVLTALSVACVEGSIVIGKPRSASEPPQAVIGYHVASPASDSCISCENQQFSANFQCPKGGSPVRFGSGPPSNFTLPTSEMTVEAWVKFNRKPFESGQQSILSCYVSDQRGVATPYGEHGFQLGLHNDLMSFGLSTSDPYFYDDDGNQASGISTYQGMLRAALQGPPYWKKDRWYHVAGTYDGAARRLFIDGELWGVMKQTGDIVFSDCEFAIGASAACGAYSHAANDSPYEVAEVRMWGVARTQQQLLDAKDTAIDTTTAGLLGVWREVSTDPETAELIVVDETGTSPPARVPNGGITSPPSPQAFPPEQGQPQWEESPSGNCISIYAPEAQENFPELLKLCEGFNGGDGLVLNLGESSTYERVLSESQVGSLASFVGFLPPSCQSALQQVMCTRFFSPCRADADSVRDQVQFRPLNYLNEIPPSALAARPFFGSLPLQACLPQCEAMKNACAATFNAFVPSGLVGGVNRLLYNQDDAECAEGEIELPRRYPVYATRSEVPMGPFLLNLTGQQGGCGGGGANQGGGSEELEQTANFGCMYPMTRRFGDAAPGEAPGSEEDKGIFDVQVTLADAYERTSCVVQCPAPVLSSTASLEALADALSVFGWVSLGFSLTCLLVLLSEKRNRKFPGLCVPLMLVSLFLQSLALTMGSWGLEEGGEGEGDKGQLSSFTCQDASTRATVQGDSLACDAQAALLQFSSLCVVFYWAATLFFLLNALNMKIPRKSQAKYYLGLPPFISLLLLIVAVATGSLGASSIGTFCWLQPANVWVLCVCYYLPLLAVFVFSFYFLFKYKQHRNKMAKGNSGAIRTSTDKAFRRMASTTFILSASSLVTLVCTIHIAATYPGFLVDLARQVRCQFAVVLYNGVVAVKPQFEIGSPRWIQYNYTETELLAAGTGFSLDEAGIAVPASCVSEPGFYPALLVIDQAVFALLGFLVPLAISVEQVTAIAKKTGGKLMTKMKLASRAGPNSRSSFKSASKGPSSPASRQLGRNGGSNSEKASLETELASIDSNQQSVGSSNV